MGFMVMPRNRMMSLGIKLITFFRSGSASSDHHQQPSSFHKNLEEQVLLTSFPRLSVSDHDHHVLLLNQDISRNSNLYGHTFDQSTHECDRTDTGGACKKARVLPPSSSQPPLQVRKPTLGDRITTLHQLVAPFGKSDTASVLLETIEYIKFLQTQIQALSSPYMGDSYAPKNMRTQQVVERERNSCFLAQDPAQKSQEKTKGLWRRGLCVVPVSCTDQLLGPGRANNPIGADYCQGSNLC